MKRILLLACCLGAGAVLAQPNQRCATRLSANLVGLSPEPSLLASSNPQAQAATLLQRPEFVERFASFINSRFNPEPATYAVTEAAYVLAKKILSEQRPWKQLFAGNFVVARDPRFPLDFGKLPLISETSDGGLGYFTSTDWRFRYVGNEQDRYRLVHAYRLLNNTIGLNLKAAVNTNGVDTLGRKSGECAGCHYRSDYGLDLVAKLLAVAPNGMPREAPQTLLGGQTLNNEKELIAALVNTPEFTFNSCRLAMQFAYGRPEYACEGPVFDACVTAFRRDGTMQSALLAITTHPTYCQ